MNSGRVVQAGSILRGMIYLNQTLKQHVTIPLRKAKYPVKTNCTNCTNFEGIDAVQPLFSHQLTAISKTAAFNVFTGQ